MTPEKAIQLSEAQSTRLIKFYEQAEREILDQMNKALLRKDSTDYLATIQRNIQSILRDLRNGTRTWCEEAIPEVYQNGVEFADAQMRNLKLETAAGFGAIHQQAAQVLAEATFNRLDDVVTTIGRRTDDIFRQSALESVRGAVTGYDTWQQAASKMKADLKDRGITGFKDSRNREWNMSSYTKMVARTTTMEAHLEGTRNRLLEHGQDLVKISSHSTSCPLCAPWQGRILSLSGQDRNYPDLQDAKDAGLFHPNCKHAYGLAVIEPDEEYVPPKPKSKPATPKPAEPDKLVLPKDVKEKVSALSKIISKETGLKSSALKKVVVNDKLIGAKGTFNSATGVLEVTSDASPYTIIHEILHSYSKHDDIMDRVTWSNLEEGTVELFTQQLAMRYKLPGEDLSYRDLVSTLMQVNHGFGVDEPYDFALSLFKKKVDQRYDWVESKMKISKSNDRISVKDQKALKKKFEDLFEPQSADDLLDGDLFDMDPDLFL